MLRSPKPVFALTVLAACSGSPAMAPDGTPGLSSATNLGQMVAPTHANASAWPYRPDSPSVRGAGSCAAVRLEDVVASIRAQSPVLSDIATFKSSGPMGPTLDAGSADPAVQAGMSPAPDGTASFYTAFRDDDSYGVIFFRGGQCRGEACSDNEYWYFETGAGCSPKWVGYFRRSVRPGGRSGICSVVEGAPLWSWPTAPAARSRCDADWSAQNISGTRKAFALDPIGTCTSHSPIPIQLTIAQEPDLSKASVSLTGTEIPFIDGVSFGGAVERQSFTAELDLNPSGPCSEQHHVKISLDFESPSLNGLPGGFGLMEISAGSCASGSPESAGCQASLHFIREP